MVGRVGGIPNRKNNFIEIDRPLWGGEADRTARATTEKHNMETE